MFKHFDFVSLSHSSDFPYPIRSIYDNSNEEKISKIALSCDGKFLITATEGRGSLVKLWKWSFVTSKEDDKARCELKRVEKSLHKYSISTKHSLERDLKNLKLNFSSPPPPANHIYTLFMLQPTCCGDTRAQILSRFPTTSIESSTFNSASVVKARKPSSSHWIMEYSSQNG